MSDQQTISALFEQDHDRLDAVFQSFHMLKRRDPAKAKEAFQEFKFGLQRHIVWEESLLFPLWEEKTGLSDGGPTFVMRKEHREIQERLEAIQRKIDEQNPESDQEEEALLKMLGSHNLKEERVLYPSIDQVTTPEERQDILQEIKVLPEHRLDSSARGISEKAS